ncbi:protein of unknown function [Prevotella communis]|uniref:DUF4890 domain-containing protein n=1 Tax=Prevotella communis TaxID=2913614 RepID=A0A1H0I0L3_9BACT|nr:DUF4890 domain-containing protein [Prevotella communis]SDG66009.1 protein of unknown function [Prevotella communis]SDO24879.1 protein of unknown function [Prevotella communis]
MKKLVLTMIAMVTMSLGAMAQDTAQVRRQFNPEQMAKMRTDAVVKKYGLNDDQAKKLLDLNTRFAGKIRPMGPMGGQRRGGQRMQGDRPQRMNPDSLRAQGQRRGQGQRGGGFNREEMQKNMEDYNNELKSILTPEQYEAYQKDEQQNRRQFNGPRRERPTQRQ